MCQAWKNAFDRATATECQNNLIKHMSSEQLLRLKTFEMHEALSPRLEKQTRPTPLGLINKAIDNGNYDVGLA